MLLITILSLLLLQASSQNYSDIYISNLSQDQGVIFTSDSSSDYLGYSVNKAGDFNNDGYEDILISAVSARNYAGNVYVIFGSKNGLSNLTLSSGISAGQGMVLYGANSMDQFGYSVNHAGDVNDDGIDDIIIGASSWQSGRGIVYVIYGSKTPPSEIDLSLGLSVNQGFTISGGDANSYLGASVSYAGDVNSDGIDDVIISALTFLGTKGAAYVIFGKKGTRNDIVLASGLGSTEGFMILGASSDLLGASVSYAGDVDGDGIGDIIVGAYGNNVNAGAAYVIYGQKGSTFATIDLGQGLSQSQGFMIKGNSEAQLGFSVGNAGDFNGDGKDDVLIGGPAENSMAGGAFVIFGRDRSLLTEVNLSSKLSSSRGIRISLNSPSLLGFSTKGTGDINGDGLDDILITAPYADSSTGIVYVIFGNKEISSEIDLSNGLDLQEGFRIVGGKSDDMFGTFAVSVGDMNGDGLSDILIANYVINSAFLVFSPNVCSANCETCEDFSVCLVCETGYMLYESACFEECPSETEFVNGVCTPKETSIVVETVTQVAQGLFDSGSTASRLFTMGRSLSVGLGLMAKIIQNVRYLDIDYPKEALNAFENYGTNLFEMPIPEIFYESPDTKDLPERYSKYEMSPTFMKNYWQTIMSISITLVCFFVIKLIQHLTRSQNKGRVIQVALKNIGQTAANFLVIQIYSNLDDVVFFFGLDASSTKMSSVSAGLSMGIGSVFLILGIALVFFHGWVLRKYQQAKEQNKLERFQEKFKIVGTLFEDFKDDTLGKQSFFGVLIFRCVLMVLVIMFLEPPFIQAGVLMLINLAFLVYFVYQRPFKSLFDEISQYFCEATIFAAYLSVLVLGTLDYQGKEATNLRNGFGKCIVISGIVLSLGGFIIQVIQIGGVIYAIYQFFKENSKKKHRRVPISVITLIPHQSQNTTNQMNESSHFDISSGILGRNLKAPDSTKKLRRSGSQLDISSFMNTEGPIVFNGAMGLQRNQNLPQIVEARRIKVSHLTQRNRQENEFELEIVVPNRVEEPVRRKMKIKRKPRLPKRSNENNFTLIFNKS